MPMMSFIEEIQVFVERNYYEPYQISHHYKSRWGLTNGLLIVIREDHGKWLFHFRSRPMYLLTLDVTTLMYSSNIKDVSNIIPKCSCDETCWTGLLWKKIGGRTTILTLRVKITSCACLDGSETHLPLESPFLYFVKIYTKLFSRCIWIIGVICNKFWFWLKTFCQIV